MERAAVPSSLLALASSAPARTAALLGGAAPLGPDGEAVRRWASAAEALDAFAGRVGAAFLAAGDDPTVLSIDTRGDGEIVEVYGDLSTATSVAIVVPGIETTLANEPSGLRQSARHVYDEARALGADDVAVIAWLGYDTPGLLGAPFELDTDVAALDLTGFVRSLELDDEVTTTIVAHSYGSLVAGVALRDDDLEVDNVVVLGSPGMGVGTASQLHLEDTALYALRAPFDLVSWSEHFGRDPSDPRFGAVRLATGTGPHAPFGHSSYFDTGTTSLHNIGAVVAGRPDLLVAQPPSTLETAAGALDDVWGWTVRRPIDDVQALVDRAGFVLGPARPVVDAADAAIDLGQRLTSPDLWGDVAEDAWRVLGR
jgi:pimeloyl-ACP methyl ester carboxylesterase